jgi:hypothetical protein
LQGTGSLYFATIAKGIYQDPMYNIDYEMPGRDFSKSTKSIENMGY